MNSSPNTTWNIPMTQSGITSGIAFGTRASGVYAPAVTELPGSFAGSVMGGATRKRHADAQKNTQGILVWSPPS